MLTINLINMKNKVQAICLKTYVDEDDIQNQKDNEEDLIKVQGWIDRIRTKYN